MTGIKCHKLKEMIDAGNFNLSEKEERLRVEDSDKRRNKDRNR